MIEARGLVKRYGPTTAVDNLSFDVRPGTVTGFLGPNGAGKSTTMRMFLGLDRPDAGTARVNGKNYHDLRWPLREVGALLEAKAFHPGRSARAHLTALAGSNGIPRRRVNDVLEITGMGKQRVVRKLRGPLRDHLPPEERVMTTATLDRAATPSRTEGRYGFRTVAQMEWLKLRSVRSTWWTLLVFAAGMVGLAILVMRAQQHSSSFDPTNDSSAGL